MGDREGDPSLLPMEDAMNNLPASAVFGLTPVPPEIQARPDAKRKVHFDDTGLRGVPQVEGRKWRTVLALLFLMAVVVTLSADPSSAHHGEPQAKSRGKTPAAKVTAVRTLRR
jgi:hypothetical protein